MSINRKRLLGVSFLCLLLITTCVLQVAVGAVPVERATQGQPSYADPTVTDEPVLIPQGEVVSELLGGISQDEKAYLNAHSVYSLAISNVPKTYITAHDYNGGVRVTAKAYTYTTTQGVVVTWTPALAWSDDGQMVAMTYEEASGGYTAQLAGKEVADVVVTYTSTLTLPQNVALNMVNEAYESAQNLMTAWQTYEGLLRDWEGKSTAYTIYLGEYHTWKTKDDAHKAYLQNKVAVDAWWTDYNRKQAAIDAYNKQMSAYETWEQYKIDLKAYEDYMALVSASPELKETYERQVSIAQGHLNLMDRMFVVSEMSGYSFEGVLNSGAADYVINNKNLILNMNGVNEADVRNAISATYDLRALVADYQVLTTPEDKYAYYIAHREAMVAQMNLLYDSMMSLGQVEDVIAEIDQRGGREAFVRFVGNLYVQSRLLDDTKTLDETLVLYDQPLTSLMERKLIYTDTNKTTPVGETYPKPPVTADDVTPVPYPGDPPPETQKPAEVDPLPDINTAPAKLTEVAPAGDPPQVVANPGDQPNPPKETSQETALRELATKGALTGRDAHDLATEGQLSLSGDVHTQVLRGKKYQVTVMDEVGEIYEVLYIPYGESAEGRLTPPQVTGADGKALVFIGWASEYVPLPETSAMPEVTLVDITFVGDSMTLYPVYAMASTETDTDSQETTPTDTMVSTPLDTEVEQDTKAETTETSTQNAEDTSKEAETQTQNTISQVPWYAQIMGAVGLRGLVVIAGVILGGFVAGGVMLIVRLRDKKRQK